MKRRVESLLLDALSRAREDDTLRSREIPPFTLEAPRRAEHGDFAANLALVLAPIEKTSPRAIAQQLLDHIRDPEGWLERIEIAGPGFLNFTVSTPAWHRALAEIEDAGETYGRSSTFQGKRALVEFVSVNPTGPVHVGHGRGAAVGNALARILEAAGYDVVREYYLNDVGNQMELLARSVYARYLEVAGEKDVPFAENFYQGGYVKPIAQDLHDSFGDKFKGRPEAEWLPLFREAALKSIWQLIQVDLALFGVEFDSWVKESDIVARGEVERALKDLRSRGYLKEEEGALWFCTTHPDLKDAGDDKDRVILKRDGALTYFASDIAYHRGKIERGFDLIADVWGRDHHGYVPRMRAAMKAFGAPEGAFRVVLVDLVTFQGGKMGKRLGRFETLRALVEEIGADVAKFIFLTRGAESPLDVDLDALKIEAPSNPVYYLQYMYTRCAGIFRKAAELGVPQVRAAEADLSRLTDPDELALIRMLAGFPEMVADCARTLEPHRLTTWLLGVADRFHAYFTRGSREPSIRVLAEAPEVASARLVLVRAIQSVAGRALNLLGVAAPDRM